MTTDAPTGPTPPYVSNGTIHLGEFPRYPSMAQADAVMRVVSEHFGHDWYAVKLSGWWLVYCKAQKRGWGSNPGEQTKSFCRALAQATDLTVERINPPTPKG